MDYVARHGPLAPEDWLAVGWQVGRAVQALHGRGMLHRSLRPSAVLVRRDKAADGKTHLAHQGPRRRAIAQAHRHPRQRQQPRRPRANGAGPERGPHHRLRPARGRRQAERQRVGRSALRRLLVRQAGRLRPDGPARPGRRRPRHSAGTVEDAARRPHGLDHPAPAAALRRRHGSPVAAAGRGDSSPPSSATCTNRRSPITRPPWPPTPRISPRWWAGPTPTSSRATSRTRSPTAPRRSKLRPGDAALYRRRGLAHARTGAHDQAIADFTESLQREPRNLEALANRALAHAQRKEHDRAIADYTEAIRLNPRDERCTTTAATPITARRTTIGRSPTIRRRFVSIRATPGPSATAARRSRCAATTPGPSPTSAASSTSTRKTSKRSGIAPCRTSSWAGTTRRWPITTPRSNGSRTPPCTTSAASATPPSANYEQAVADLTEALALDPKSVGAYRSRTAAYLNVGTFPQALADLDKALKLQPDSADVLAQRGMVQFQSGAYAEAVADYTRSLELKPDQAEVHFDRGVAHAGRGDLDAAVADCSEAIRLAAGTDATLLAGAAYVRRGDAYARLGDDERALADFAEAIRLDPIDAAAYARRADVYARLRDPDESDRRLYRGRSSQPVRRRLRWSRRGLRGSRRSGKGVGGLRRGGAARPAVGPRLFRARPCPRPAG